MLEMRPTYEDMGNGALDLSLSTHHRNSVETHRTPSPSNTSSFSSEGSPRSHASSFINTRLDTFSSNIDIKPQILPKSPSRYSQMKMERYETQKSELVKPVCSPTSPHITAFTSYQPISTLNTILTNQIKQRFTPPPPLPFLPCPPVIQQIIPHVVSDKEFNYLNNSPHNTALSPVDELSENFISTSTTASTPPVFPMMIGRDGKLSRPFKAYPHDPLSIAASFTATDSILDTSSTEKFNNFRKRMLQQIHAANGGHPTVSNPKMRRTPSKSISSSDELTVHNNNNSNVINNNNNNSSVTDKGESDNQISCGTKDAVYYERRKKNNAAAKKSRDRRRIKEDEIAIRAAFLERENIELRIELSSLRKQLSLYGVNT